MIRAILNIIGVRPGDTVLDPMVGSGTTCVEASLLGIDSIGVEASPFCCLMGNAKLNGLRTAPGSLRRVAQSEDALLDLFEHTPPPQPALFRVNGHNPNGIDVAAVLAEDRGLASLVKLAYLDAVGYAKRRVRKTARDLFSVVLGRYIEAVERFATTKGELDLNLGDGRIVEGDGRDLRPLGIANESIAGVITSPPYSFAIDYVENDAVQLEYIGADPTTLRGRMIGLHGKNLPERYQNYLRDMRSVLSEAHRVLKPGKFCVVVLGTNSNQLRRLTGNESPEIALDLQLNEIARACGYELVSDLIHPIEGIGNTMKDEHLLFYKKLD
jgi:DNA modification methylase